MEMTLSTPLLLGLLAFTFVLSLTALITAVVLAKRQKRILNQYRVLLANGSPQDLETILVGQATTLEELAAHLQQIDRQVAADEQQAHRHIQKVGMIRFNAFPDTGSDQSFSVALLDADGNGLVLTSLYGRTETRTYAKPIQGGKSTYPLSDEELGALAQAQGK